MSEHAHAPYYKVLGWLTFLTAAEIAWALWFTGADVRGLLIAGLGLMAAVKAMLVAMYYMHLKYEGKLLISIILFPLVLVVIMIAGFLPDAVGYW